MKIFLSNNFPILLLLLCLLLGKSVCDDKVFCNKGAKSFEYCDCNIDCKYQEFKDSFCYCEEAQGCCKDIDVVDGSSGSSSSSNPKCEMLCGGFLKFFFNLLCKCDELLKEE